MHLAGRTNWKDKTLQLLVKTILPFICLHWVNKSKNGTVLY